MQELIEILLDFGGAHPALTLATIVAATVTVTFSATGARQAGHQRLYEELNDAYWREHLAAALNLPSAPAAAVIA
jgi:hypothetical protein